MPNFIHAKKPGIATLVAVTIVMFTSLLVGLAVSQRAGSGIRRSTYTGQTDQAFACATSGVESALLCITNEEKAGRDPATCAQTDIDLTSCKYKYTVRKLTDDAVNIDLLEKDSVQQLDVSGRSNITLEFGINNADDSNPGLEVSYIYKNGSAYEMKKFAYLCPIGGASKTHNSMSGFDSLPVSSSKCSKTITLDNKSPAIVRIRPYFADINLKVSGLGTTNMQGYSVSSSGTAGTVTRNVEVLRMSPQLPAIFDYVLYSEEGSITK